MNKTNLRPVSILACFIKICEKLYCDQLLDSFNKVVSKFLSAFRKGYSCETVFKMIEDWRKCLSEHKIVAAMLIDLTKALTDCHTDFCWLNLAHTVYLMIVAICSCPIYRNVNNE